MAFFGKLVATAVNTVKLPVAVAKDVVTLGNYGDKTYTEKALDRLVRDAQ